MSGFFHSFVSFFDFEMNNFASFYSKKLINYIDFMTIDWLLPRRVGSAVSSMHLITKNPLNKLNKHSSSFILLEIRS